MVSKQFRKRSAILDCIRDTASHPSAEMVYEMLKSRCPDISLATVYRNLALFKSQGLIQSVGTFGGIERFDANTAPHVHFVCMKCHKVLDLPQLILSEELSRDAEKNGDCQVTGCQLTFSGYCSHCKGTQ